MVLEDDFRNICVNLFTLDQEHIETAKLAREHVSAHKCNVNGINICGLICENRPHPVDRLEGCSLYTAWLHFTDAITALEESEGQ